MAAVSWVEGLIDGVTIRDLQPHADSRGWLIEVFRDDECSRDLMPAMGYVSMTMPGQGRGPHAHRDQTDTFAFVGPGQFVVRLWDPRPGSPTRGRRQTVTGGAGQPVLVIVPPGIIHGYRNQSNAEGLVLNFPNRLYAGRHRKEAVDEVRYENDPASGFTL